MKKLALVTAMALSTSVFALESMTDSALSAATGQDGITIQIDTPDGISIDKILVHDKDGYLGAGLLQNSGAIQLGGTSAADKFKLSTTGTTILIDADGGTAGDARGATLNVNVALGATTITTGSIGVADSKRQSVVSGGGTASLSGADYGLEATTGYNKILDSMDIALGGTTLNIQLGGSYQANGALIKASGTVTGGITVSGLSLNGVDTDSSAASNAGKLGISKIFVKSSGSADLTFAADINISTSGLTIKDTSVDNKDIILEGITINASTVGDVELQGLDMGDSVITITGH